MERIKIREPVVAGQFYPKDARSIENQLNKFMDKGLPKVDAIGCILPHAGYIYSGKVATLTASRINIKDRVVLLGPNHTGYGKPFSVMAQGSWRTPFGSLKVDSDLARAFLDNSKILSDDCLAHMYEHSLEVELPILQYFKKEFQILPICIMSTDIKELKELGCSIAQAIKDKGIESSVLIIASSDMTHYEPKDTAEKKDKEAIEAILELDCDKLLRKVRDLDISMCGYCPTITLITAAKLLGAKSAELVKYETSASATGDTSSVVGYAGITIF